MAEQPEEELEHVASADCLRGNSTVTPAELACRYIAMHVRRAAGRRWLQGPLKPPHPCDVPSPYVRLFAQMRLRGVPGPVARGLVAWARGERPIDLLFHIPTTNDVLALQARGRRCVSLLSETTPAHPHKDGLAFAIHDLCHAEKFFEPGHYEGQVGFFADLYRATRDPRWNELDRSFDTEWVEGRDHVMADMNGSAVFLLLALKSKLKMAIRRKHARSTGTVLNTLSPPDLQEEREWAAAETLLCGLLHLDNDLLQAACALSSKGGAPAAEARLFHHFRARGEAVLATALAQPLAQDTSIYLGQFARLFPM